MAIKIKRLITGVAAFVLILPGCGYVKEDRAASSNEAKEDAVAAFGWPEEQLTDLYEQPANAEGSHNHGSSVGEEGAAAVAHAHRSSMDEEGAASAQEHEHGSNHEHGGNMSMEPIVSAQWIFNSGRMPEAGRETAISIELSADGKPIESFDTIHEEKQHLVIVSADLSYFSHIHPIYLGKGKFEVKTTFPSGGTYKLIADFAPQGASAMQRMTEVKVSGAEAVPVALQPQTEWNASADGMNVQLSFDAPLKAGKELTLQYAFRDAQTGAPVTDLQPYLGEAGHVIVLSRNAKQYLHVHPLRGTEGSTAAFKTVFPSKGVYKIWAQFKRNDAVLTIPFVVRVQA